MDISNFKAEIKRDYWLLFMLLQVTVAAAVLIFAFCSKTIGGGFFDGIKTWYETEFMRETSVIQVIEKNLPAGDEDPATVTVLANNTGITTMCLPISGSVTSPFGYRIHPIYGDERLHRGVDIGGDYGQKVHCALDGKVIEAGQGKSYGNYVVVSHGDHLKTLYAHCQEIVVKEGEKVAKGDTVALVGSTGDSTGPHLHFEIIIDDDPIDPQLVLDTI